MQLMVHVLSKLTSVIQATVLLLVLSFSAIEQRAPFQKETKNIPEV